MDINEIVVSKFGARDYDVKTPRGRYVIYWSTLQRWDIDPLCSSQEMFSREKHSDVLAVFSEWLSSHPSAQ